MLGGGFMKLRPIGRDSFERVCVEIPKCSEIPKR